MDVDKVGVYHCMSRCVQQASLCGTDPVTGKSYRHRRGWVASRLRELSGIFGIEVLAYAAMSNHLHVVLRNRPDVVSEWSDEEVALRWGRLFPSERDERGKPKPPDVLWLNKFLSDPKRLSTCRERLGDISWLMRCLDEWVARRANKEVGSKGRFWEGRFKCQYLEDQGAMLACMTYVELNPLRVRKSKGVKDNYFTSLFDRTVAQRSRKRLEASLEISDPTPSQKVLIEKEKHRIHRDDWLAPFSAAPGSKAALPGISLETYIRLVEWTGKNIRKENKESLPLDLVSLVEELELDAQEWVANVKAFGGLFHRMVGKFEAILGRARQKGQQWMWGKQGSQRLYRKPIPSNA